MFGFANSLRIDRAARGQKLPMKIERRHAELLARPIDRLADLIQPIKDRRHGRARQAVTIVIE